MKRIVFCILCFFILSFRINAEIINIPTDQPTIQQGIDVASANDTILIADGTYYENLQINGKEIMLASWFIIDSDSSHIENTIIDGSLYTNPEEASVIAFFPGDNPNAVPRIIGLTLINGFGWKVEETIQDTTIEKKVGGGLYIKNLNPVLSHNHIKNNAVEDEGGGGYVLNCIPNFGGEIEFEGNWDWERAINPGGNVFLNNFANVGKTIYVKYENDPQTIYMDNCYFDIYNEENSNLTNYWASSTGEFSLNNISGVEEFITSDIYVSTNGNDENDGLTLETAFRHINYALSQVYADLLNPITIHIAERIYSPSLSGEEYPLQMVNWVSLEGVGEDSTVLDAESIDRVLMFDSASGIMINSLTITNGNSYYSFGYGGGIYCVLSDPVFINVSVVNNSSSASGGGLYFLESYPNLENTTISNNFADWWGGGISCHNSDPILENVSIRTNSCSASGGGISCQNSNPIIENMIIANNSADSNGGGISFYDSTPNIVNTIIENNTSVRQGGGIYCSNSNPNLENVTIKNNSTDVFGGGFYCVDSVPIFSNENLCNIYLNNVEERGNGSDIYSTTQINVVVDTFTVTNPTDFHASPIENFSFEILNGIQNQVNSDLYVSPDGDNNNSGLNINEPLRTIQYACSIVLADSLTPRIIFLSEGTYSNSQTGELFPISLPDNVSLVGENQNNVILDAEGNGSVVSCAHVENVSISDLTITNGDANSGGGIYCYYSGPVIENVKISNNSAGNGGGIHCYYSNPVLENVIIEDNSSYKGGGIYCHYSDPVLINIVIKDNSVTNNGGGIYCNWFGNPILENVTIANNSADDGGGGIFCYSSSYPTFSNENRCNIYMNNTNFRESGSDIYSTELIQVIVDTFTVLNPTNYHASPIENFTFDILHSIQNQINADLYVSPDGNNNNSGLNINEPLRTIQFACSIILADNQNPHAIFLSEGTYSPSINGEHFPIILPDFVSLIGESQNNCILDAEGSAGVIKIENTDNVTVFNLTITNGDDFFGGGIYCYQSNPDLYNLTITNNNGLHSGGIHLRNFSNPNLMNLTIINNSGQESGGIKCGYGCNSNMENITISENVADYGGGINFDNSFPILNNVMISNNMANIYGGGMYFENSYPTITNLSLLNNSASSGGGLYFDSSISNPIITDVVIKDNIAYENGGGIACHMSSPFLLNAIITSNMAYENGGGVYCIWHGSPVFRNLTMSHNTANGNGGGIYNILNSNPYLQNCIMWFDNPEEVYFDGEIIDYPNSITIMYSDIEDGEDGIITNNNGTVNWMAGNISEDPLFVGIGEDPYLLSEYSQCIDAGIPDTTGLYLPAWDIIGNHRVWDGDDDGIATIDMGAYEYGAPSVNMDDNEITEGSEMYLYQNYPNPFNPCTNISFNLIKESIVEISIYNIKGQEVKVLINKKLDSGLHTIKWNGTDNTDKSVASGIYLYRLKTGGYESIKRMLLLK